MHVLARTLIQSYTTPQTSYPKLNVPSVSSNSSVPSSPRSYNPLHVVAVVGGCWGLVSGENHLQSAHACV